MAALERRDHLGTMRAERYGRVIGDPAHPAYAMLLEVTVPPGLDLAAFRARLTELADALGVECSLHESEADIL